MQWMQRRPKDNAGECDRMVDQTECVETEKKPCEELGQDTTDDYWGGKVALSSRAVMEEKLGGRGGTAHGPFRAMGLHEIIVLAGLFCG